MEKILYIQAIHPAGMDLLREKYDVVVAKSIEKASLMEEIRDASAVISRLTVVDRELIEAGQKLKAIAKNGVGVDNIDVACATEKGIPVLTTGQANLWSVAEHTVFAMGALCKRLVFFDQRMRAGDWKSRDDGGVFDVAGRTFGIAGFGRIGRTTGKIVKAMGMRVLACDKAQSEEGRAIGEYVDLDRLLAESDVIFLHCPLFPDTKEMINRETIARMKDGVILINNSRGALVVEEDLAEALNSGKVYAAGLDVTAVEPIPEDNPLLGAKNCLITPHISWAAKEARQRILDTTVENVQSFLAGKPVNVVNG